MRALANDKSLVQQIADAVLYEGYILYPYRPSAVKNQQRWNFGALCPESYAVAQTGSESSTMQTECLVEVTENTTVAVTLRFLHLLLRQVSQRVFDCQKSSSECGHFEDDESRHFRVVPFLEFDEQVLQTWQEAVEREVELQQICLTATEPAVFHFSFPRSSTTESLAEKTSGEVVGTFVRTQDQISGTIKVSAQRIKSNLVKLTVEIHNLSSFGHGHVSKRDDALMKSFVSTHTILQVQNGAFISQLDPPADHEHASRSCVNTGTFPVLVGTEGDRDCILSSPIILYDYPQIAAQSEGDLFDGTEIDEILTLRIMTLTDEEKREVRSADALARQLLERTEAMSGEQLMKLHGVMRRG
jgi:hypothetical protein